MPKKRKLSTGQKLILLGALDLAVTIITFIPRKAKPRRKPPVVPDMRSFRDARGEATLLPYLLEAERASGITGLATFGKALAKARSGYDNKYVSRKNATRACSLYLELRDTLFARNPYAEREWCWGTGGWYGFAPAEVMGLTPFQTLDPRLVFDPAASTAMLAGLIAAIIEEHLSRLPPQDRTWTAVARGMENLDALYDNDEALSAQTGSAQLRETFLQELYAAGISRDFASTQVPDGPFASTQSVWDVLQTVNP